MVTIKEAIDDLKRTARFADVAIRAVNNGKDSSAGQAEEASRRLVAAVDLVDTKVGSHYLHTNLDFEAGLCAWEEMLDRNRMADEEWAKPMLEIWEACGTVVMRHMALDMGSTICAVWDIMSEEERHDCVPYDWEFVPAFVRNLTWDTHHHIHEPVNVNAMKAAILTDCRARNAQKEV